MKPSLFHLVALLAVACLLSPVSGQPVSAAKPNIIVIVSDDCGYNEFSLHGAKLFPTPRIDSIATNGVRFSNGYVSGAVCSPTRAGLLTGRYQQRFGHEFNIPPAYNEDNGLPSTETTLADVLKTGGYRTIALGKWHLGYAPKFHPLARGFDDYYGFLQGSRSYFPLEKGSRLNQLLRDREPVKPEKFEYMTDELGRAAAEYIDKNKSNPFFMYLAFNATHSPMHALESDIETVKKLSPENVKLRAMALAMDRAVGKVIDGLKKQSLLDNTLLIFVNDNGGAGGRDNAPLRGHKGSTWEGGVRVPFAMQWPAVLPKDKIYDKPVISLDIFPTAMAAAGVGKTSGKPLDGVNLIPHLTGKESQRPHQTLFWKNSDKWAVRDGDLKLVAGNSQTKSSAGQTAPELYDLSKDPGEQTNLAASRAGDIQRLQQLYEDWKRDFPKPLWGRDKAAEADDSAAEDPQSDKPLNRMEKRAAKKAEAETEPVKNRKETK